MEIFSLNAALAAKERILYGYTCKADVTRSLNAALAAKERILVESEKMIDGKLSQCRSRSKRKNLRQSDAKDSGSR